MITRLEATRYRCFERLGIDLGNLCILVGANGSGKTTLLDMPTLIGDLLTAKNLSDPFLLRRGDLPPRAGSLSELVYAGRGNDFSLAIEAKFPEEIQVKVLQGALSRLRTDKSRAALEGDRSLWHSHIRYELGLQLTDSHELQVSYEYLFLFSDSDAPDRRFVSFHGVEANQSKRWHVSLKRENRVGAVFKPEVVAVHSRARETRVTMSDAMLAMPRVLFESEEEYPAARWLHDLLAAHAVFLQPDWSALRQASAPGQPKVITANGRNIPWLALELKREGAPQAAPADYRSERYADWIAHVQTALPQVTDIEVREREDDHHAYFVVSYKGDFKVPSPGLSDGTLRILTLTLLPYLSKQPAILVTEEPENGIHPRAIEAVLQSLSSMYDSQVWVSSHSPVVLARAKLDQLLCARLASEGGVEMVAGTDHPRLQEWRGGIDLGSLFAAGVLG